MVAPLSVASVMTATYSRLPSSEREQARSRVPSHALAFTARVSALPAKVATVKSPAAEIRGRTRTSAVTSVRSSGNASPPLGRDTLPVSVSPPVTVSVRASATYTEPPVSVFSPVTVSAPPALMTPPT